MLAGLLLTAAVAASPVDPLATLKPGHPRLYWTAAAAAGVKRRLATDAALRGWYEALERRAPALMAEPVARFAADARDENLEEARRALRRIGTLAGLWRLDGDPAKAARAKAELLALAALPDWNPAHFLDVAETTHAVALGYDWLYPILSPAERATVEEAIAAKGLEAGIAAIRRGDFWVRGTNNWTNVCYGGLVVGALAVGDRAPALARAVLEAASWNMPPMVDHFGPDGGWDEGPGYWRYALHYTVDALAALGTATGRDLGLRRPALAAAGNFKLHMEGPTRRAFNFADAKEDGFEVLPHMFWLGRAAGRPAYALDERARAMAEPDIFHLVWAPETWPPAKLPLDARFRGVETAAFRSAWGDPMATYLAFKGGDNAAPHGHFDLGSFVLDAGGQRWALDLGPDGYGLPGYLAPGAAKGRYYRASTAGHNTLTIDGESQAAAAVARITAFGSAPARAFAVADLGQGYLGRAASVKRGVALLDRKQVLIQDEVVPTRPGKLAWHMHTRAAIALDGAVATLSLGDRRLVARVLAPAGAAFAVRDAAGGAGERKQPDVHDLVVELPLGADPVRLAVQLDPTGTAPPPAVVPLARWAPPAKPARR